MFRKRKLTFYVNGERQSIKAELISKGKSIGERKWKSYNVLGKNTIISTLDEKGNVIENHYFDKKGNEVIEDKVEIKSKPNDAESSGYEHYFTPDSNGNVSGIRIEKAGKLVMNSVEYWADDRKYKIRKTENSETHTIQYFIHEYTYDKEGQIIKEKLYSNEME